MRTLLITLAFVAPSVAHAGFVETTVTTMTPPADSTAVSAETPIEADSDEPALATANDKALASAAATDNEVDAETESAEYLDGEPFKRYYHGFRLGYTYVNGVDSNSSLRSPHLFVLGYEATQRFEGGDWLNVIVVENVSVAGLNQSMFIPSANGLVGFEIADQIQIGTGVNFNPFDPDGKIVHQVIAAGWTPKAGKMNVPVHFTVIPDSDGHWRLGSTIGVNW